MQLTEIRQHLIAGNLEQAFRELENLVPEDLLNDLHLLWAQYNDWRREDLLVTGAKKEECSRIRYATLSIVSHLEKEECTGLAARRVGALRELELDLAKGYAMLSKLRKKSLIDKFLLWIQDNHKPVFQEILREEKEYGRAPNLPLLLLQVDFSAFIRTYALNASPEDARRYFLQQDAENSRFFSGWIEYYLRQEQYEKAFAFEVTRTENQYDKLLKAGLLGGLFGAVVVEVFQRGMDNILSNFETGLEVPDFFTGGNDDEDDDD